MSTKRQHLLIQIFILFSGSTYAYNIPDATQGGNHPASPDPGQRNQFPGLHDGYSPVPEDDQGGTRRHLAEISAIFQDMKVDVGNKFLRNGQRKKKHQKRKVVPADSPHLKIPLAAADKPVPETHQNTRSRYHEGELLSVNLTPPLPSPSVTGNRPKRAGGSFAYYHQDNLAPVLPQVVSSAGDVDLGTFEDFQGTYSSSSASARPKRNHGFGQNFHHQHIGGPGFPDIPAPIHHHHAPPPVVHHHIPHSEPHHDAHPVDFHGKEGQIAGFFDSKIHGGFGDNTQFSGFDLGGARFRSALPDLSGHFPHEFPHVA